MNQSTRKERDGGIRDAPPSPEVGEIVARIDGQGTDGTRNDRPLPERLAPRGAAAVLPRPLRLAQMAHRHAVGALVGTLTHELSQPLSAITMYSSAAARLAESRGGEMQELAEVLGRIETQVKRAAETLARMRALAHPGTGEKVLIDLSGVIGEVASLVHSLALEKKVTIDLDLPTEPVMVSAIRSQVVLAVLNLLLNSVEAISQSDSTRRLVRVSVVRESLGGRVTVHDSGPGISQYDAARVFDGLASDEVDGCGLGLAISRSLIEGQGGLLWVDTAVTEGAALHLLLPGVAATPAVT
jgi:C4-dicarboxylate-specific signal transduction histidine kinase